MVRVCAFFETPAIRGGYSLDMRLPSSSCQGKLNTVPDGIKCKVAECLLNGQVPVGF